MVDYTANQARLTAEVAGLEKRVDKTDASIQGVKTELKAEIQGVKTELKKEILMLADKTDASNKELKTELLGALKEMKTELLMRADKTDASIQELKTEIKTDIQGVKTELKSDIQKLESDGKDVKTELKDVKGRMDRFEIIIGAVTIVAGAFQYINSNAEGIGKLLGKWPGGE